LCTLCAGGGGGVEVSGGLISRGEVPAYAEGCIFRFRGATDRGRL